jgi:precorrin-2 dehydrogenase/sirohydrochlorin ferrochelatase
MSPASEPPDRPPGYPVVLLLSGRKCLVVGGGPVAARRAEGLLEAGARVTLVTGEAGEAVRRLDPERSRGQLVLEIRPYEAGEARRYDLVITATGRPEVDRQVIADATDAGVPASGADGASPSTLQLPAVHRDGPLTVAVSTGGASPALARWVRDRLAAAVPVGVGVLAGLLDEARTALREAGRPTGSVPWQTLLDEEVGPLVEAGRVTEARAALRRACGLDEPDPHRPPPSSPPAEGRR